MLPLKCVMWLKIASSLFIVERGEVVTEGAATEYIVYKLIYSVCCSRFVDSS